MIRRLLLFLTVLAVLAYAADISGTWKGSAETGNGTIERTFIFKVDGNKLTGETTSEMMGKSVITDGIIDGDDVSFTITGKLQDNEVKLNYKGKVHGTEMKLSVEIPGGGQTIEWSLKKLS